MLRKIFITSAVTALLVLAVGVIVYGQKNGLVSYGTQLLALVTRVFPEKVTPEILEVAYEERPIKVLIVPGHDNKTWGTEYKGVKEADLNLIVAKELFTFFSSDKKFEAYTTRDFVTGDYGDVFADYFVSDKESIKSFMNEKKEVMKKYISSGQLVDKSTDNHTMANEDMLVKLYGINKWAEDNAIDLTLHLHFNDYAGRKSSAPGKYSGFSIYIPESQFPNASVSRKVSSVIYEELEKYFAKSNMPLEVDGLIEDQELISVGSNASRSGASMLLELGYIYEPVIVSKETCGAIVGEMAYRIYRGVVGYFDQERLSDLAETTLLPFYFEKDLKKHSSPIIDTLHLQSVLLVSGVYPPQGRTLSTCPLSGVFGPCVSESVVMFRNSNNLIADKGIASSTVDAKVREKLNQLMGE